MGAIEMVDFGEGQTLFSVKCRLRLLPFVELSSRDKKLKRLRPEDVISALKCGRISVTYLLSSNVTGLRDIDVLTMQSCSRQNQNNEFIVGKRQRTHLKRNYVLSLHWSASCTVPESLQLADRMCEMYCIVAELNKQMLSVTFIRSTQHQSAKIAQAATLTAVTLLRSGQL